MNATCLAGISQPQRVSDLGRLLDSEITAPLDSTPAGVVHPPAWRLPLRMAPPPCMAPASLHGAFICMAPSSLQGALINGACSLQSALAFGACSLQGALTSPCARGHFIRHTGLRVPSQSQANFLMSVAFPKKRCFLPHLAHVSHLSQPQAGFAWGPAQQDRRRALRVLFGTDDTRCVTRSVRRTKPHTNTQPTAHSQRPARHLHRDPSISYYQRSASAT